MAAATTEATGLETLEARTDTLARTGTLRRSPSLGGARGRRKESLENGCHTCGEYGPEQCLLAEARATEM